MQIGVTLVDWEWLERLPDPASRIAALLNPSEGRALYCYDLGCWYSDSAMQYSEIAESLEAVAEEVGGARGELMRAGFPLITEEMDGPDELGLRAVPDSSYFGSLSPTSVVAALEAARQLDLKWLAVEIEPSCAADTERYLRQWISAFSEAQARGMGLVVDCS